MTINCARLPNFKFVAVRIHKSSGKNNRFIVLKKQKIANNSALESIVFIGFLQDKLDLF